MAFKLNEELIYTGKQEGVSKKQISRTQSLTI